MNYKINMPSYVFPELVAVLATIVIGISSIMPGIDRISKRYFIAYYSILVIGGVVFSADMFTYMDPDYLVLTKWFPPLEYFIFSLPFLLSNIYLLYCCGENLKKSIVLWITISLWIIFLIMLVISQLTSIFCYTGPDGQFYITPLHPLLFVPLISMSIIGLVILVIKRNRLSRKYFYAFLFYLIIVTITTIIHSSVFSTMLINIAFFIGSITMYLLILTDQIDQYMNQKIDISNKTADIMVLQMRPHFIYNTMTSIYYLCDQDPKKAQRVILDLTSYLRKNYNALASDVPIPFPEELEHIRAYLSVELAQFEDNLIVEYDTPHTRFRLPPLTLQPIVENAIKHGMNPDSEPLRILIQTRDTDSGSVIIVKDNGPGFDPKDVFNSHNALSNIKQRLKLMCRGDITITSEKGKGTAVEVVIPH